MSTSLTTVSVEMVEEMEAEIEQLRAALREIAEDKWPVDPRAIRIAKTALALKDKP